MKYQQYLGIPDKGNTSLNKHVLRVVSLAFFLLMTYFLVSDYFTTINHAEKLSLERLQGIVNDLAIQIDGDKHQVITSEFEFREDIKYSQQNEEYQLIHNILERTYQTHHWVVRSTHLLSQRMKKVIICNL